MRELLLDTSERFEARFGVAPGWLVAAPGRVNVIGEHVDYNDGIVLPMAIDRHVVMAAGPMEGDGHAPSMMRVYSVSEDAESMISAVGADGPPGPGWEAYVAGVAALCAERGCAMGNLNVLIHSDLPAGSGLSSSAALEVATATLAEMVSGKQLGAQSKIQLCQKAEHDWAGVPCGIMDQSVVTLAQRDNLLMLDCMSLETRQICFDDPAVSVLITNSGVSHQLSNSPYAERRAQCELVAAMFGGSLRHVALSELVALQDQLDPTPFRRARHVVTEISRTLAAIEAIQQRDWSTAGAILDASHASLRDDFEVSCDELDYLVEIASELGEAAGVYGSRMTGGGFGGCTVTLVSTDRVEAVMQVIDDRYRQRYSQAADFIVSRPVSGARDAGSMI